ncbi:unnamed protein product, partial [Lymnaea stagnalis]
HARPIPKTAKVIVTHARPIPKTAKVIVTHARPIPKTAKVIVTHARPIPKTAKVIVTHTSFNVQSFYSLYIYLNLMEFFIYLTISFIRAFHKIISCMGINWK